MEKELYLTKDNQQQKIDLWIKQCRQMKRYVVFEFDLSKSALLILDMQQFFLDEENHAFIPSANNIIPNIQELINFFDKKQRPIIFTQHIDTEKPKEMMTKWWRDSITAGSEDSRIVPQLNTDLGEIVTKNRYSAFEKTNLESILREKGIEQLIVTGIMSHLCCETTVRDAFMKDFEVFFVVDANATYTEELHRGTLKAISHGFGICIPTEEITNA
ncbi:MAG: isochorismatase family protein [Candidatus Heimdallarchaeaceae archaeon]